MSPLSWQPAPVSHIDDLSKKATALLAGHNIHEAEAVLQQILQISPNHFDALFNLGSILLGRGDSRGAFEYLKHALQLNANVWQANGMLGLALWKLQEFALATQLMARAERLMPADVDVAQHLTCKIIANALEQEVAPDLWADTVHYLLERNHITEQTHFLAMCGFDRTAPQSHKKHLVENIAVPLIAATLAKGDFGNALRLHEFIFKTAALSPHTQEQWAWCMDKLNPLFVEAGESLRKELPELPFPGASDGPPVVAFIVDYSIAFGSGFTLLMTILEQVAQLKNRRILPVVYTLVESPQALTSKCQEWGIPLVDFDAQSPPPLDDDMAARLVSVREQSRRDRVSIAVYFSSYEAIACLASSIGLAPLQVYFTMLFHSIDAPRLNAYFAFTSFGRGTKLIRGRPWQTVTAPSPYPFPAIGSPESVEQLAKIADIRAQLHKKFSTLLGTIARAEKLDDAFVDVVALILRQSPGAAYLWFGHENEPVVNRIANMFRERGLADRCLFMGWVDTKIFSRVLDIHLDCFGLPTGFTMAQTFSAGNAYVLKRGAESEHIGLTSILASITEGSDSDRDIVEARALFLDPATGESLMMLAEDTDQYIAFANHLIRDIEYRGKVGRAAKQLMDKYFHESDYMGKVFEEHLVELVADARASLGCG